MRAVVRAKREAQRILTEARVSGLPIPVERIARNYAQVIKREIPGGISGMLVPLNSGSEWVILVNASDSTVRQRFTIAHELAHRVLHDYKTPHADKGFRLRFRDARSSDGSILEEIQANQFAAELLMPEKYVLEAIESEALDYDPSTDDNPPAEEEKLKRIARRFNVSKQAMLIRLSNLMA